MAQGRKRSRRPGTDRGPSGKFSWARGMRTYDTPPAGPVTVTKADGSTHVEDPLRPESGGRRSRPIPIPEPPAPPAVAGEPDEVT